MHKYSKFTLLCPGHVKICEKYGVHMSLLSYFIDLELINEILSVMVSVHFYCLFQNLSLLLCTHSLLHPWLSTEGSGTWTGGPALHPLWSEGVRRIGCVVCCAETWGVSRAWDITLRHPTLRGPLGSPPCSTAFPNVQSLPVEWMGVLLPR